MNLTCFPEKHWLALLLTGWMLIAGSVPATCEDIYIPADYPSLKEAVSASNEGDHIIVSPGVYTGSENTGIEVTKQLVIRSVAGPETTIIDCRFYDYAFHIARGKGLGRNTLIQGFTIRHANSEYGAMHLQADITIKKCIFDSNQSTTDGGALFIDSSPRIAECLLINNRSDSRGGAAAVRFGAPLFDRCTFAQNEAGSSGTAVFCSHAKVQIVNSIVWDPDPITAVDSSIRCHFSVIRPSFNPLWIGDSCLHFDPMFTSPDTGDFSLQPESPCIDSGDPLSRSDIDGSRADIGWSLSGGWLPEGSLGGSISGTILSSPLPLLVVEDLIVQHSDELLIIGPLKILFRNNARLLIEGSLSCDAPDYPVVFMPDRTLEWFGGISACSDSRVRLTGVIIEQGASTMGGALYAFANDTILLNVRASYSWAGRFGGGICMQNCEPLLVECDSTDNFADGNQDFGGRGGGFAFIDSDAFLLYSRCDRNTATAYGGGVYSDWDSSLNIASCHVRQNTCLVDAAGISSQHLQIRDTHISYNQSLQSTGGMWFFDGAANECIIEANSALTACGGATSDFGKYGISLFIDNHAQTGGASYISSGTMPGFHSCTFSGNTSDTGGGAFYIGSNARPMIHNCIVWENQDEIVSAGQPNIRHSDIRNGTGMPWFGEGCIDKEPLFTSSSKGLFFLSQKLAGQTMNSPCIDGTAGQAAGLCFYFNEYEICLDELTTRTDGIPDVSAGDMGYHYRETIVATPTYMPERTPTWTPTSTSIPTSTPTPGPTTTPEPMDTPDPCAFTEASFRLPAGHFFPKDTFYLVVDYCLVSSLTENIRLYVVLEASGMFFFYPGWSFDFDFINLLIDPGHHDITIIPPVIWPDDCGSSNARFWLYADDPRTNDVVFPATYQSFGWSER